MKRFLTPILTNLFFVAIVCQWFFAGSEGAHNVAMFLIWLHGVLGILVFAVAISDKAPPYKRQPRVVRIVSAICEIAILYELVWHGEFLLTAVYMVGLVGSAVYRSQAPKEPASATAENISAA